jgi:hypothetical protein
MAPKTKNMLGALAAGLLGACACACGAAVKSAAPAVPFQSSTTPIHGYIKGDQDGEPEVNGRDEDDTLIRGFGHPASAADRQAVAALVKRYYAAAASGDSAAACALTFAGLAKSANFVGATAEDYEPVPGRSPPLRGKSCIAVMSVLTKERHEELVADIDTLVVVGVFVRGAHGLAYLGFGTTGERFILVERERGTWKVDGLFDKPVT